MNRSVVLKQGFSFMWDPVISSTAAVDKYTARMILNVPFAPFPATMAYFFVVNKKVILEHLKKPGPYGDMGDYGTEWLVQGGDKGTLAGSGPYAWLERVPGTQDKFERFKDYWRGWRSEINLNPIDVWIHRKVPEEATLKTLLRTREVQMVWSPWRSTEWYTDLANEPFLRVDKMNGAVILNTYQLNCTKPPLDDRHVRRALSYCFDYDTYIKDIRKGLDTRMTSCIGRSYGMFNDQIAPYTLDLNKAEEELSKSKYSKADIGKRSLEFSWTQPIEDRRLSGLLLKTNAEKVGFKLDLTGHEWMQYASRVTKAETNPDMATVGELGFYPDPDAALYPLFHSTKFPSTQVNPSYYINPEVDKLLDDGRTNTDPAARLEIYKKVEQMIYDDAPMIWTGEVPSQSIMDKRIKGWIYNWDFENYMEYPLYWQP
jgi:peptide/nickel transport system substrate-binding protein